MQAVNNVSVDVAFVGAKASCESVGNMKKFVDYGFFFFCLRELVIAF
jgi:hypothetical protein